MEQSKLVGTYVLDTLQIFFAWDDDLYTYFKEQGLGQKGVKSRKLPLIYTDNCESTTGVAERQRKNIILPEYFGETYDSLGWKEQKAKTRPIIKAEKPEVKVSLEKHQKDLRFRIIPRIEDKEQYHLEYSSMSAFGHTYKNWSIIVLRIDDFQHLLSKLKNHFQNIPEIVDVPIHEESKNAQREKLIFVEVPVKSYIFSIGEFLYARRYFELNGITGLLPSLIYQDEPSFKQTMDPILKLGFVHTKEKDGFEVRPPQCALKVCQPKISISKRGKKAKKKGEIVFIKPYENQFTVSAKNFLISAIALKNADPLSLFG